jgi:hypothetical protein
VFERALAAIGRFEWRGVPVAAWLFRIASNALADHWRERARDAHEAPPDVPDAREVEDIERGITLYQHVEQLPDLQRQVIRCGSSRRRAFARWRPLSSAPKAPSSSSSSARWRTCERAWVAMAERALADRLDETIDAIVARGDATAALRDPELAPLARIAADCATTRARTSRRGSGRNLNGERSMTHDDDDGSHSRRIHDGDSVHPRARGGLVDFLVQVFDAQETFSGRGGGGGMHREVRVAATP